MAIAQNIIFMHAGSVATIPSGWVRVTDLDDKFLKGTATSTDPNVTGGATTHSHSATATHTHGMDSHSHTVLTYTVVGNQANSDSGGTELATQHYHNVAVAGVVGGSLSAVASTYASVSNHPPYYEVIFITPSGATGDFADGIIGLWNASTVPSGFTFCDGSGGTPDLRNKYLKGATAGAGAGTTGGSTTNIHTLTHTHTESTHYHSQDITEAGVSADGGKRGTSGTTIGSFFHKHEYRLNSNSAGGINTPVLTTVETVEPVHTKLMVIKNTSGGVSQPQTIIGMWTGTLASIPAGWSLCDGSAGTPDMRNQFLKVCNTSGELRTTGGSNTHTHASQTHSHTGSTHTHTSNMTDVNLRHNFTRSGGVGGSASIVTEGEVHAGITSISSTAPTWGTNTTEADSQDNQPPYLTVAFIMYAGTPTNSSRAGEVTGKDSSNSTRSAETRGVDPAEERACEVVGKESVNSERGCEISGLLVWDVDPKPTTPTWTVAEKLTN